MARNGNIFAFANVEMNSRKRVRLYFVSEKHFGHTASRINGANPFPSNSLVDSSAVSSVDFMLFMLL
jgi:hypothetical protein